MQIDFSSACACAKACRTPSTLSGCAMAKTRAEVCCEWMSLTRMPGGGGFAFDAPCASAVAGAAAASAAACRKSRRFRVVPPR